MGCRLATGLKSLGIGRGDHVVVSLPNMPEVFACFGAIWRIGAVIVPIMFLLGENETRYIKVILQFYAFRLPLIWCCGHECWCRITI